LVIRRYFLGDFPMPRLGIPYRSKWAADADRHSADCGPTCAAMIMSYNQIEMTPNRSYSFLPPKEPGTYTHWGELIGILQSHQIPTQRHNYVSRFQVMGNVRVNIDAGNPMTALVKYEPWIQATDGFAKALDLNDLFDPDLKAWDYNELGRNSFGIGFVEG
jgi:hypothetical protein